MLNQQLVSIFVFVDVPNLVKLFSLNQITFTFSPGHEEESTQGFLLICFYNVINKCLSEKEKHPI